MCYDKDAVLEMIRTIVTLYPTDVCVFFRDRQSGEPLVCDKVRSVNLDQFLPLIERVLMLGYGAFGWIAETDKGTLYGVFDPADFNEMRSAGRM